MQKLRQSNPRNKSWALLNILIILCNKHWRFKIRQNIQEILNLSHFISPNSSFNKLVVRWGILRKIPKVDENAWKAISRKYQKTVQFCNFNFKFFFTAPAPFSTYILFKLINFPTLSFFIFIHAQWRQCDGCFHISNFLFIWLSCRHVRFFKSVICTSE